MLKQKNIVIDTNIWDKLKLLSDTVNMSISKIIRNAVDKYLKEETTDNLVYQMRTLTPPLQDEQEEQEITEDLKAITKNKIVYGKKIQL